MSAWRIGRGDPAIGGLATNTGGPLGEFVDLVVKWIPGEVVAFYGAAIVVASDGLTDLRPSRSLWVVLMIATVVLVVCAGLEAKRDRRDLVKRSVLGLVSFLIWSASVPFSGWMSIDWFAENAKGVAIGAALAGIVFVKIADLVVPET